MGLEGLRRMEGCLVAWAHAALQGAPALTHCFPEGHYPLGRCSGEALGDNSREEGCSSSEGGAVEGLGTGPHPGLSLLGHPG